VSKTIKASVLKPFMRPNAAFIYLYKIFFR